MQLLLSVAVVVAVVADVADVASAVVVVVVVVVVVAIGFGGGVDSGRSGGLYSINFHLTIFFSSTVIRSGLYYTANNQIK